MDVEKYEEILDKDEFLIFLEGYLKCQSNPVEEDSYVEVEEHLAESFNERVLERGLMD